MEIASTKLAAGRNEKLTMQERRTRLWQRLVLGAFTGATRRVQRLSRPTALRFGATLGRLGYRIDKKRGFIADRNLRLAFGDALTPQERQGIICRSFEHWGRGTIDFLRAPASSRAENERLVSAVEGREWLDAVRAEGRGFIVVTGHIGNFEFLGRWMADQGVPSTAIVRDPADPAFAAYVRQMREYGGNETLNRGTSPKELLSRLRKGGVVTLGIDQNCDDVFLPFFGVPAGTVVGPALLALRTETKLLPAFCVSEPDGSYRIIFGEPICVTATGDKDADMAKGMTAANLALESVVRRYPDQWLWLHNRWKSAFREENRARWPAGYDFEAIQARWRG